MATNNGLYPWQVIPSDMTYTTASGTANRVESNVSRDVQVFKRLLEAMGGEPVDVNLDTLYGRGSARVFFRYSHVYSQVDIGCAYGDHHTLEELANQCIKMKNDYQRGQVQKAYEGKDIFPASAPPPKKKEVDTALNAYRETNRHAVIAKQNSYENPLRVKLQKEVDAWLC